MKHGPQTAAAAVIALALCELLASCGANDKDHTAGAEPRASIFTSVAPPFAASLSPELPSPELPSTKPSSAELLSPSTKPTNTPNSPDNEINVEVPFQPVAPEQPLASIDPGELATILVNRPFTGGRVIVYQTVADQENVYAAVQTKAGLWSAGVIGYSAEPGQYDVSEVDVFDRAYVKITGACGANCPISTYVRWGQDQQTLLRIEAHTVEADLGGDGQGEIVATVGTVAETTIYALVRGELAAANLNELLHAGTVIYNRANGCFQAADRQETIAEWTWNGDSLTRVPASGSSP